MYEKHLYWVRPSLTGDGPKSDRADQGGCSLWTVVLKVGFTRAHLEMQIPQAPPTPTESETLITEPRKTCFHKPFGCFRRHASLRNNHLACITPVWMFHRIKTTFKILGQEMQVWPRDSCYPLEDNVSLDRLTHFSARSLAQGQHPSLLSENLFEKCF